MHDYFLNLQQYIDLLLLNEQLDEINNMIKHCSKKKHPCHKFRNRFSKLKGLKSIKQDTFAM